MSKTSIHARRPQQSFRVTLKYLPILSHQSQFSELSSHKLSSRNLYLNLSNNLQGMRNYPVCGAGSPHLQCSIPTAELGALILTNGITNANFYAMISVLLFLKPNYALQHEDCTEVHQDVHACLPRDYYIVTNGMGFCSSGICYLA